MFFIDSEGRPGRFDADRAAVYEGIVKAICEAFGIVYVAPEKPAETGIPVTPICATEEPSQDNTFAERVAELIDTDPTAHDAQERSLPL